MHTVVTFFSLDGVALFTTPWDIHVLVVRVPTSAEHRACIGDSNYMGRVDNIGRDFIGGAGQKACGVNALATFFNRYRVQNEQILYLGVRCATDAYAYCTVFSFRLYGKFLRSFLLARLWKLRFMIILPRTL